MKRPQDFAGRYGGEEFVVLLYDATPEYSNELAESIRKQVLNQNIEHLDSTASKQLSVSIGHACLNPARGHRSLSGFIQMADEALYAAKEGGRNCVVDAAQISRKTETGVFRIIPSGPLEVLDVATASETNLTT